MADEKEPKKTRPTKRRSKKNNQGKDEPVAGGPRAPGERNPADIHREYVEQHKGGGAPPTRQAYDAAMNQWRKLPGAIIGVPRDVQPDEERLEEQPVDQEDEPDEDEEEKSS
ncbi:hypothetical protein [Candidatus Leptofilum sp.]|uniref:hypothetical protein n=1 Tax=Candidatus Leptofilum sp. TaxID=3241576 RepID=UPI003B5999A4